jgi:hypothetical protein
MIEAGWYVHTRLPDDLRNRAGTTPALPNTGETPVPHWTLNVSKAGKMPAPLKLRRCRLAQNCESESPVLCTMVAVWVGIGTGWGVVGSSSARWVGAAAKNGRSWSPF